VNKTTSQQIASDRRYSLAIESYQTFGNAMDDSGAKLEAGMSVFGITRGQFSMIDIVRYFVDRTKPAKVSIWTWAIADYEIETFEYFYRTGDICDATLIVDRSAEHRNESLLTRWRDKFGKNSVKVCKTHAKIATIEGNGFKFLCRGSMNLNHNPRFEQFDVSEGGAAYSMVKEIESEIPVLAPHCSNRDANQASGLLFAWGDDELKEFTGTKHWAK